MRVMTETIKYGSVMASAGSGRDLCLTDPGNHVNAAAQPEGVYIIEYLPCIHFYGPFLDIICRVFFQREICYP